MKCLVCLAILATSLLVPAVPPLASERVVMYRDNFGADLAFIDRFLKDLAPKAYRPDESWDLPELTLDGVFVGRYDVNDDGIDELFLYVLYSCGSAGCDAYLFEQIDDEWMPLRGSSAVTIFESTRIDGEWVAALDVWIDPATGYKSVLSGESGFRWTGEKYAYINQQRVLELSALIEPNFEDDGVEMGERSDARAFDLGHLMPYVGTSMRLHVLYDPAVKAALDALLGTKFAHLRINMDRPSVIGYENHHLVLQGWRRFVWDQEFPETAMLLVDVLGGAVHVGIESRGVRTVYSNAEAWNDVPEPLRRWAHGSSYAELVYGEGPPSNVEWKARLQADKE